MNNPLQRLVASQQKQSGNHATRSGHIIDALPRNRHRGKTLNYTGHKGTALFAEDHDNVGEHSLYTVSDGITRRRQPNYIPPLDKSPPSTTLTIFVGENSRAGTRVQLRESALTTRLQCIMVKSWQFTSDLLDTSTGALPVGPVLMKVESDTSTSFSGFETLADNIADVNSSYFPLMFNTLPGASFTEMPRNIPPCNVLKRWKDGNGEIKDFTLKFVSPSDPSQIVTFSNATIIFELVTSSWNS